MHLLREAKRRRRQPAPASFMLPTRSHWLGRVVVGGSFLLPWLCRERFHKHRAEFRELQKNCQDLTCRLEAMNFKQ